MTPPNSSPSPDQQSLLQENALDFSQQLSDIQNALSQLTSELTALRKTVDPLIDLPQKVDRLERQLMVVGDLYRYDRLHTLLSSQQWFNADKETVKLIASIAKVTELEELSPRDIRSFSCGELQVIDRLWTTYSDGHFGFSIQLQIYQSLGGNVETTIGEDQTLIERWGAQLGWREGVSEQLPGGQRWRSCDELDFSLTAPRGCHPSRWWNSPYGSRMTNYFLNRLITCEL